MIDIEDFSKQAECVYKDEQYSVRDNGAVLRHSREGKKPRPTDNQWTFGKPNEKTGYMEIASVRVHRIVATAFIGEPPNPEYVIDHIDTNRRNNRPENLRWLTRLENALKNPITLKRIITICGSVEAFLKNPKLLRESEITPDFSWMRAVSKEEAQASLQRFQEWVKNDSVPMGGSLGEWLFAKYDIPQDAKISNIGFVKTMYKPEIEPEEKSDLYDSLTINAAQRDWRTPTEFLLCPQQPGEDPIATYTANMKKSAIFTRNIYGESVILDFAVSGQSIIVMTEFKQKDPIKPYAVAKITYEDGLYVHSSVATCFEEDGARKYFTLEQGLEWMGGDTFDDYC